MTLDDNKFTINDDVYIDFTPFNDPGSLQINSYETDEAAEDGTYLALNSQEVQKLLVECFKRLTPEQQQKVLLQIL